jgi:hypothetical protein
MKFPHHFLWAAAVEKCSKQQNRDFRPDRTPKPLKFVWGNFNIQKYPTIFAHSLIFRSDSVRSHLIPLPHPPGHAPAAPANRRSSNLHSRRTAAHGICINVCSSY